VKSWSTSGDAGRIRVRIAAGGETRARGKVRLRDGTSSTILVAERNSAHASCADADGDGTGGLTWLSYVLRDARTGATHDVTVIPDEGEADEHGVHPSAIRTGNTVAAGRLRIRGRFG
jgi:hypothetical protein